MAGKLQKPKVKTKPVTPARCYNFQIRFEGLPNYSGDLVHNVYLPPFGSGYGKKLSVIGYLPDDYECLKLLSEAIDANTLIDIWFSRLDANKNVVETIRYKNSKIYSIMVDTFNNKDPENKEPMSVYLEFTVSETSFCKTKSVTK